MKKLITILVLSIMCMHQLHSQYYKWAHELPFQQNGRQISKMVVDTSGNVYTLGINQTCTGCTELFVRKEDKSGNLKFEYTALPAGGTVSAAGMAVDKTGNIFISAVKTSGSVVVGTTTVTNNDFIFKLNSSGDVRWVLQNESGHLAADTAGAVYVTNGTYTKKYDASGVMKWQYVSLRNATGIGLDKYGICYVTSTDSIIKINKKGKKILYAKNYGAECMTINKNGNVFLLTSSSLTKLTPAGNIMWTLNSGGSSMAVDKNSAIYIVSNNAILKKVSASGMLTAWTIAGVNAPFTDVGVDNSRNIYACGNYSADYLSILGSFKLADKNGSSFAAAQSFTTSFSGVSPYPFQAGIFTGDLYSVNGNKICLNQALRVPYSYSLNSFSSFGPANEFRAQVSDDNFQTYTDIGPADSAVITSLTGGDPASCRIRVVSTDPPVNGYPNYSINVSPAISIVDNRATISANGPTSFCLGYSVDLTADLQPYTTKVEWYRGNTFLGNTATITATETGDYHAVFQNGNCEAASNRITLTAYPKEPVTITADGPTTFCAGGSVRLTANPSTGLTYQWRKNGVNIQGATSADYVATESGKYSVKTINSYGCLKVSYAVTVSVPCRMTDKNDEQQTTGIYPNPFSDIVTVAGYENISTIKLRNLLGQEVFEKKGMFFNDDVQLYLSMLKNGIYFMEIKCAAGSSLFKVVKQN